jgi:tetratricopeptide (TPR) repeat protein
MKVHRPIWLLYILLFTYPCLAEERPQQVNHWFQVGNVCYSKGDFKGAIENYQRIVRTGFANEVLYYNLGNAFYKDNQIGWAILFYEKARRLAPSDPEILNNLKMARSRTADKVESLRTPTWLSQVQRLHTFLSLETETILGLLLYMTANALFSIYILGKRERIRRAALHGCIILGLVFLIIGGSTAFRVYEARTVQDGVVVIDKVDVLSGPGTENPTLFSIHEGLQVEVQHEMGEWVLISLENGWSGWVKKEVLGRI